MKLLIHTLLFVLKILDADSARRSMIFKSKAQRNYNMTYDLAYQVVLTVLVNIGKYYIQESAARYHKVPLYLHQDLYVFLI